MVGQNVHNLLQQACSLSLEEREQLMELLKRQSTNEPSRSGLAAALAVHEIKLTIPPKKTPEEAARFSSWRHTKMPGGSLSDELIRDRR